MEVKVGFKLRFFHLLTAIPHDGELKQSLVQLTALRSNYFL